ncbi:MAG TPA: hypothetical protein VK553_08995, partial [Candidatus Nitrosopolaris rasttigaisensis]|nr:hypothetical protein [Candidatus Nitrosopolaris rasttigaisensis]
YNIMQEEFISENICFFDIIIRNANRLQRLTDDILDVQKIESRTLTLNKERFDLNDLILRVVDDHKLEAK